MSAAVKRSADQATRAYDGSRRRAGSEATQRRIVEAATELFLRDGYGRTSIEQIAEEAGVSPATIYKLFKNKVTIAKRVGDVAVAGDHEDLAVAERPAHREVLDDPDPQRALRKAVEGGTEILVRITPVIEMARAGAHLEPVLGELAEQGDRARWMDMAGFVVSLQARGALRPGLSKERATDAMWVILSPDTYRALVLTRGWRLHTYREWVADQLAHALLAA
jgi:AcrR family transcriptional regulator